MSRAARRNDNSSPMSSALRHSAPRLARGAVHPPQGGDRHAVHGRRRTGRGPSREQVPMAAVSQDVGVEIAQRHELEEVCRQRQGNHGPEHRLAQGAAVAHGLVQGHALEGRGVDDGHSDRAPHEGRGARAQRGHGDDDVTTFEGVPLVPQHRHHGCKHRGAAQHVDAIRGDERRGEQVRAVVQVAEVIQRQSAQQRARGQKASEVPHGPGPPDGHALKPREDEGHDKGADRHNDERKGDDIVCGPTVEHPPIMVRLGGVRYRRIQHLRQEQENETFVREQAFDPTHWRQAIGAIALRGLEEQDERGQ
mmetsp:Transcript_31259/g.94550  ORF Transcript_31259/g.94550 Transcript_31259/m.94550 type:complete len:308 (-) Transcript_31259:1402-2325(-)